MSDARDDFYVGYLPMPPAHRAFLRWVAPSILWAMVLVCGCTLAFLDPAPPARWETGALTGLQGMVRASPYPLIEVRDAEGRTSSVLLTGIGKRAAFVAEVFADSFCTVRGYPLERDGRRILELMDGHEAMIRLADQSQAWLRPEPLPIGRAEFDGEILDSKCWHGAMRPGEGRAHKACATLCVRGGIAPMLIVQSGPRAGEAVILLGPDGGRANPVVLPFLGEPVRVRGEFFRQGGILWLRLDPDGVTPAGAEPDSRPEAPIVSFRFECEPGTPGSIEQVLEDGLTANFGPVEVFEFAYVGPSMDRIGAPAVAFEIAEHQKQRFSDLTAEHVGKRLAIYLDGALSSAPEINERLPGAGIINGGLHGFTQEQMQDLIERLRAQATRK